MTILRLIVLLAFASFSNVTWADNLALKASNDDQVWLIDASTVSNKKAMRLGQVLFFDPRLLGQKNQSCATCHYPGFSWSRGRSFQQEAGVEWLSRQVPSLLNVYAYDDFFWDGRIDTSLQVAISAHFKTLMVKGMKYRSQSFEWTYKKMFEQAFGQEINISPAEISRALVVYVATIQTKNTAFDGWLAGEKNRMSATAIAGFRLFEGKADCVRCHSPPYFTDSSIHNTGIHSLDSGYYDISKKKVHYNAFRTPMLRQVSRTAPYMHNGSFSNLKSVVAFYNKGGTLKGGGNDLIPLHLTNKEQAQLVAFLKALEGEETVAYVPPLPIK